MAHKKSGGAKARQGSKPKGKRLGVKIFAGQITKPGEVLVRQKGSRFHAGDGVMTGRDFTLFATTKGKLVVKQKQGRKFFEIEQTKD